MSQLNLTNNLTTINPPPRQSEDLPILVLLKESYLLWHSFLLNLPRFARYTLGEKIDGQFINILEITLTARYAKREDKLAFLLELSKKLDNLKFFVTLMWEAKGMDAGKYGQLSQKLASVGRMLGKWLQKIQTEQNNH